MTHIHDRSTSADIAQHVRHRETPDQRHARLKSVEALARNMTAGPWAHPPRKRPSRFTPFARFIVAMCGVLLAVWAAVVVLA